MICLGGKIGTLALEDHLPFDAVEHARFSEFLQAGGIAGGDFRCARRVGRPAKSAVTEQKPGNGFTRAAEIFTGGWSQMRRNDVAHFNSPSRVPTHRSGPMRTATSFTVMDLDLPLFAGLIGAP
jgi:hypothetical protein